MARLRERNTGSIVNVPDDEAHKVLALGYYEPVDEKKSDTKKTTTARKSSSSSK